MCWQMRSEMKCRAEMPELNVEHDDRNVRFLISLPISIFVKFFFLRQLTVEELSGIYFVRA